MNTLHNIDSLKTLSATVTSCLTKLNTAQNRIAAVAGDTDALQAQITQAATDGDFDTVAELSTKLKRKAVTDSMKDALHTARRDYVLAADELVYALQSTYNLSDVAELDAADTDTDVQGEAA